MSQFLTIEQAGRRVHRSPRTIGRWIDSGLRVQAGLIREEDLLEAERAARGRRGRPRAVDPGAAVLAEVAAERARQNTKWGEQNHPDGTGPEERPLWISGASGRMTALDLAEVAKLSTDSLARRGEVAWTDILLEEVFEALAEVDHSKLRAELIQVAAVAVQWAEAIDRTLAMSTAGGTNG